MFVHMRRIYICLIFTYECVLCVVHANYELGKHRRAHEAPVHGNVTQGRLYLATSIVLAWLLEIL